MHILFGKESDVPADVLAWINEGTPVYDRDGRKIGSVKQVHPGGSDMQNGFIQIDCGILWPERCATSDQIASLNEEGIWLNVAQNEVMML